MSTTTAPRRRNLAGAFAATTPPDRSAGLTDLLPPRSATPAGSVPAPEPVPLQRPDTAFTAAPAPAAPSRAEAQDVAPQDTALPEPDGKDATPQDTTAPSGAGTNEPGERTSAAPQPATISDGKSDKYGPPILTAAMVADDVVRSVAVYLPPALLARLKHAAHEQQVTYADVLVQAANTHAHDLAARFAAAQPPAPTAGGMPTRATASRGTGGIQTQLRLDGHQIAWLDMTARQIGAPSRSALVTALLDAALPTKATRA